MTDAREPAKLPEEDPRNRLAGERTLLAWVRTGLAMMGFGFVVARFGLFVRELETVSGATSRQSVGLSLWIGTAMILAGVVATVLAAVQHARFLRQLDRRETLRPPRWSLGIVVAIGLSFIGLLMALYLIGVGH